jgi:hypothetical protein
VAIVYLGMGDSGRAMDYLEQAYSAHSQSLCWLKMDRIFDPLRKEPRFIALMKKVNLESDGGRNWIGRLMARAGSPRHARG